MTVSLAARNITSPCPVQTGQTIDETSELLSRSGISSDYQVIIGKSAITLTFPILDRRKFDQALKDIELPMIIVREPVHVGCIRLSPFRRRYAQVVIEISPDDYDFIRQNDLRANLRIQAV